MDDLEADWNEARKKKGSYNTSTHSICPFDRIFQDASGNEPEDLLFANPNHGIIPDDESEDDEIGQFKPLGSDPTSESNEASHFAAAVK